MSKYEYIRLMYSMGHSRNLNPLALIAALALINEAK